MKRVGVVCPPPQAKKGDAPRRVSLVCIYDTIQMYCFMPSVAVSSSALMVTVNFTPFCSLK